MKYASLRFTSFSGANLRAADLSETDLTGANLLGAKLAGSDTRSAMLDGALVCRHEAVHLGAVRGTPILVSCAEPAATD